MAKEMPMKAKISIAVIAALTAIAGISLVYSQQKGLSGNPASPNAQKMAALQEALKNGLLTQQEYDAKVAQLSAGSGIDSKKKAALDEALKSGLMTQDEYDAKLQEYRTGAAPAKAAATAPVRPAAPVTNTDPSRITWKTVSIYDPVFGMVAFTGSIPSDWKFEGAILRGSCGGGAIPVFRAYSPDELTGVQLMPVITWDYAQDSQVVQYLANTGTACHFRAPESAAEILRGMAPQLRPRSQLGPVTPPPPAAAARFAEALRGLNQQAVAQAAGFGRADQAGRWSGDFQRIRLSYNYSPGHPVEETLFAQVLVLDSIAPVPPRFSRAQHTIISFSGIRAPQGRLDSSESLLQRVSQSFAKETPYKQAEVAFQQQLFQKIADLAAQGDRQRQMIIDAGQANINAMNQSGRERMASMKAQNDAFHAFQQQSRENNLRTFYSDMQRKDALKQDYVNYAGNESYYIDPVSGAGVTIANEPGVEAWYRQDGWGNWYQFQPATHLGGLVR
ncbi:exported hypothetical protein [Candidatus Sulfopaludibacter sp. SbA4]|nr:exported hypothetical protein [Candidatus Sulfopaludibacter sp. SbA4]